MSACTCRIIHHQQAEAFVHGLTSIKRCAHCLGLEAENERLKLELAELANDARLFVPGCWECPQCKFSLTRTSINAHTGSFGTTQADREEPELCPNDGTQMTRESWEARARANGKFIDERMDERFLFAEREVDRLEASLKVVVEALERVKDNACFPKTHYEVARDALAAIKEAK